MDREKVIMELKAARLFLEMGSNRADGVVGNLGCKSGMKYIDDALELLKEQEEERKNIVHWLGKFCAYLDFKDECWSYEQNLEFFRKKMKEQFGWDVTDDA